MNLPINNISSLINQKNLERKITFISFQKRYNIFEENFRGATYILNYSVTTPYVSFVIPPVRSTPEKSCRILVSFRIFYRNETHSWQAFNVYSSTLFKITSISYQVSELFGSKKNIFVPFPHAINGFKERDTIFLKLTPSNPPNMSHVSLNDMCPGCTFYWLITRVPISPYTELTPHIAGIKPCKGIERESLIFEENYKLRGLHTISLIGFVSNYSTTYDYKDESIAPNISLYFVLWASDPIYIFNDIDNFPPLSDIHSVSEYTSAAQSIYWQKRPHRETFGCQVKLPTKLSCCNSRVTMIDSKFDKYRHDCMCSKTIIPFSLSLTTNTTNNRVCFQIPRNVSIRRIVLSLYHQSIMYESTNRYLSVDSCIGGGVFEFSDCLHCIAGDILCMKVYFNEANWSHLVWKTGYILKFDVDTDLTDTLAERSMCFCSTPFPIYGVHMEDWILSRSLNINKNITSSSENMRNSPKKNDTYERHYPAIDSEYLEPMNEIAHDFHHAEKDLHNFIIGYPDCVIRGQQKV